MRIRLPADTKVAIVCITLIEITALMNGINGTLMALTIAAISGLGGYSLSEGLHKEVAPDNLISEDD